MPANDAARTSEDEVRRKSDPSEEFGRLGEGMRNHGGDAVGITDAAIRKLNADRWKVNTDMETRTDICGHKRRRNESRMREDSFLLGILAALAVAVIVMITGVTATIIAVIVIIVIAIAIIIIDPW